MAWPIAAQVRTGELTSSLNGTIAPGYTADFGNTTGSDHNWTLGGVVNYAGSYYKPNFLSFNASVYVNQSRANSNFQSISDASGVNASVNLFGGSQFPGTISYSKAYNSEGNYSVPGVANYVTHGNDDTFGINWSESLPNAPSFSAGFQLGSGRYSVYGTNDQGENSFHSLNLHSGYLIAGFNMSAFYSLGGAHSLIPEVVAGVDNAETHSGNSTYGYTVGHRLPMQGSVTASATRSNWTTDYLGSSSSGTIDMFNALASIHPTNKFSVTASANYSDNLSGELVQAIISAGGSATGLNTDESSNSLDLMGTVGYAPGQNLQTTAYVERRNQSYLGQDYGETSYGGGATYSHVLFEGNFNATVNASGNSSDQTGADTLGFSTNANYSKRVIGWDVNGSFSYSQNVQTLLVTYMNSLFNYSANARRRWGKFNVSAGAGAGRTALTEQAGTTNSSESYNASVGYSQWLTATGSYSKADGQALATGAGLVSVPVPSPTLPSDLVSLYGGNGYSLGLSSAPVKGLILSAVYGKSSSNTSTGGVASTNDTDEFNTLIQYQYRKLNFTSGYSRLGQGFSSTGTGPEVISSFYIGVSRWFKFF
jgi:hypothetical protein